MGDRDREVLAREWLNQETVAAADRLAECESEVAAFSTMIAEDPAKEPLRAFLTRWTESKDAAAIRLRNLEALRAIAADRDEWRQQHENLLSVRQSDLEAIARARAEGIEEAAKVADALPFPTVDYYGGIARQQKLIAAAIRRLNQEATDGR